MAKDDNFNSITELYNRVLPALTTKLDELKKEKFSSIKELDIWNYCKENIWRNKKDLRIYEMVNDILNVNVTQISIFLKRKEMNNERYKNNF